MKAVSGAVLTSSTFGFGLSTPAFITTHVMSNEKQPSLLNHTVQSVTMRKKEIGGVHLLN